MKQMSRFIKKTLKVVHEYLAPQGGPIILLQIENEYGSFEKAHGERGSQYIQWAGEFAQSLDAGVPWFMCYQDNVPTVLNAQNGFYADNWIEGHHRRFPDQPAMVTELWSGWFQKFGQPKYARFAEDVAYASA
ncbi:Beta-galactosidase 6, partial [Rhizoclosmatium hyalinum]